MSRTNETRFIKWHETCKCICRLDGIICNTKQQWNKNKCMCECKELIDKGMRDKGYVWNPSIVSVNVINLVILIKIYIIRIVSVRKN